MTTSTKKQKTIFSKDSILKAAKEMTANDFLLEFGNHIEIDEMDNLLDANDGMANLEIHVKDGNKNETIFVLFCEGKFDTYSY